MATETSNKPNVVTAPAGHLKAVLQALLVTFIWSLSWILIKIGLADIPPLTFAGLRYLLAFLCLLPAAWYGGHLRQLRGLSRPEWGWLISLGLLYYTVTQGSQFVALAYLPSVTISLLLNFSAVIVALAGIWLLAERPNGRQWAGVALFLVGVMVYFYPVLVPAGQAIGLAAAITTTLATSASGLLGRQVNRAKQLSALTVTTVTMGLGAIILLLVGLLFQGLPPLTWQNWLLIGWLALVHTAFAFTLWNHTLRTLTAVESNLINNTMLIQIALLAWLFLGEGLSGREIAGLIVAMFGILVVQRK